MTQKTKQCNIFHREFRGIRLVVIKCCCFGGATRWRWGGVEEIRRVYLFFSCFFFLRLKVWSDCFMKGLGNGGGHRGGGGRVLVLLYDICGGGVFVFVSIRARGMRVCVCVNRNPACALRCFQRNI